MKNYHGIIEQLHFVDQRQVELQTERISFIVIILNREVQLTCREKNHSLYHNIYIIEQNSSEKKYTMPRRIREKPKHQRKINSIVLILQERTEFCTLLQLCVRIRSDEKISRKLFTQSLKVQASTCCLVSRHSVSVRQNSSSKRQNLVSTRYSQVWTWEERSMNSECGSDQRTSGIETYVWFRRLSRQISWRRMPRETEKHKQKIFHPQQCWFQMKRRQWKRNERRSQRRDTKNKR